MQNAKEKSFDFYLEATKQLISVASAIIAFTVVFSKDFIGVDKVSLCLKVVILISWLFFLISIGLGVLAIGTLAGQLDPSKDPIPDHVPSIWAGSVNFAIKGQQITFVIGILLFLVFGSISIFS